MPTFMNPYLLRTAYKRDDVLPWFGAREKTPVLAHYFESAASWAAFQCTVTDEATLVRQYATTARSMRMAPTAATSTCFATLTLGTAIDIRKTQLLISLYIDPAYTASNLTNIQIHHIDSGDIAGPTTTIWSMATAPPSDNGWYFLRMTNLGTTVDANEQTRLADLKKIRFRLNYPAAQTPNVIFDSAVWIPAPPRAAYAISFDDGMDNSMILARYLYGRNVPATFFVIPNRWGTGGYLSATDLRAIQSMGHAICNHGWDHEYLVSNTLTPGTALASIRNAAAAMETAGFARGARIWAAPGGTGQWNTWTHLRSNLTQACDLIRLTTTAPGTCLIQPHATWNHGKVLYCPTADDPAASNDFILPRYSGDGAIMAPMMHPENAAVVSGGVPTAAFNTHIDNVVAARAARQLIPVTFCDLAYGTTS